MWVLRVYSDELPDRFQSLSTGEFTVGASFDCDVCLLEEEVEQKHCTLTLSNETLSIQPHHDVTKASTGEVYPGGETKAFELFETYVVGKARIQLGFEENEKPAEAIGMPLVSTKGKSYGHRALPRKALIFCGIAFSTSVMVLQFKGNSFTAQSLGIAGLSDTRMTELSSTPALKGPIENPALPEIPIGELQGWLKRSGISEFEIDSNRPHSFLTVFADSRVEQNAFEELLQSRILPMDWTVVSDADLLSAASLVLASIPENIDIAGVSYGRLALSSSTTDLTAIERVSKALQQDVPLIRSVDVLPNSSGTTSLKEEGIVAVWVGLDRFILSETGSFISVGSEIEKGRVVSEILDDGSVVINGKMYGAAE